jgi:hypothetical protein
MYRCYYSSIMDQPPESQLSQPLPTTTHNKEGVHPKKIIILWVIICLLLISLIILIYQNNQLKQKLIVSQLKPPTISPTSQQTPSPIDERFSNWKTYTYEPLKLEFKYPSQFTQDGVIGGTFSGSPQHILSLSDPLTVREGTDAIFDGFSMYTLTSTSPTLNSFITNELTLRQQSPRGLYNKTIYPITIANKTSAYVQVEESVRQYFIPIDTYKFLLFSVSKQSESFQSTFEQILSTITIN